MGLQPLWEQITGTGHLFLFGGHMAQVSRVT